jgi:hypothetical protein
VSNTRRYVNIASEVVHEMLPEYRQRVVRQWKYAPPPPCNTHSLSADVSVDVVDRSEYED